VTIPARIRTFLGIEPHTEVDFLIHDAQVVLVKSERDPGRRSGLASVRGVLKGTLTTAQWMIATRGD